MVAGLPLEKFNNGLKICWQRKVFSATPVTITYPITFKSLYYIGHTVGYSPTAGLTCNTILAGVNVSTCTLKANFSGDGWALLLMVGT